jgi:hypothetical protein
MRCSSNSRQEWPGGNEPLDARQTRPHFDDLISSFKENRARPIGTMDPHGVHGAVCRRMREPLIVVRTVIAVQQTVLTTPSSVNLMQASALGTDTGLGTAAKTPKMQNENFRVREIAGKIRLSRQIGSTHSR